MVGNSEESTLVVGFDAATLDVLEPLVDAGSVPNIESLIADGVEGELRSTTPPMTPLAWTTMAAGTNPGKHGIYDFVTQDRTDYSIRPTSYSRMARPTVWDVFDAEDVSVGVVNYPMVSPPREVDEFFISGFPTPRDSRLAYPDAVQDYLDEVDYRVHPAVEPDDGATAYYEDVLDLSETQCEVTIELLNRYDPDVLVSVFMAVDWVQHYLWDETVDGENAVERCYRDMDAILGRLLDAVGDDWTVAVVSDHGARPIAGEVHLNSLLADWGFLARDTADPAFAERVRDTLVTAVYSAGKRLPEPAKRRLRNLTDESTLNEMREAAGLHQLDMHREIDWVETEAFAYGNMGRVFCHRGGVYPEGVLTDEDYEATRDELVERFESLSHPETGDPLVQTVHRGETVYHGERADEGADLVVIPHDWRYMLSGDFGESWFDPDPDRDADHDPNGMFVLAGDDVASGTVDAEIADIAPTLLALHDLPLIAGMDGTVLHEALTGSASGERPTVSVESLDAGKSVRTGDAGDVEERLEDLGYL